MSQALQELYIYKRHVDSCAVYKEVPDKEKKRRIYWHACDCMVWIVGLTPSGEWVPRQSTGHRDWNKAEDYRQSFIKTALAETDHGPIIQSSADLYMSSRNDLNERVKEDYRLMFTRLIEHCEKNNVFHMGDLKVDLLERFKTEPKWMKGTKAI